MENEIRKERIKTNVHIISITLIVLEIYVILTSIFGGVQVQLGGSGISSVNVFSRSIFNLLHSKGELLLQTIPTIILSGAVIYFSIGTYKLKEKSRYVLSILLIVKIVFLAGSYVLISAFSIISFITSFRSFGFNFMFLFMFLMLGLIVLGFSIIYFLLRRYLNKIDTVALFTSPQPV